MGVTTLGFVPTSAASGSISRQANNVNAAAALNGITYVLSDINNYAAAHGVTDFNKGLAYTSGITTPNVLPGSGGYDSSAYLTTGAENNGTTDQSKVAADAPVTAAADAANDFETAVKIGHFGDLSLITEAEAIAAGIDPTLSSFAAFRTRSIANAPAIPLVADTYFPSGKLMDVLTGAGHTAVTAGTTTSSHGAVLGQDGWISKYFVLGLTDVAKIIQRVESGKADSVADALISISTRSFS